MVSHGWYLRVVVRDRGGLPRGCPNEPPKGPIQIVGCCLEGDYLGCGRFVIDRRDLHVFLGHGAARGNRVLEFRRQCWPRLSVTRGTVSSIGNGERSRRTPLDPSNPTPHVRPKRGGVTRRLPLLLIKPGSAFNESLHGFLGNRYALRAEVVALSE